MTTIVPIKKVAGPMSLTGLIGYGVGTDLINTINQQNGSTFFGEAFQTYSNIFKQQVVDPIVHGYYRLKQELGDVFNSDRFVPLTTVDDFARIPRCLHIPILSDPVIRTSMEQGKIDGFGYSPDDLPETDIYGRLINNGSVYDMADIGPDGKFTLTWEYYSDDPTLGNSEEEVIHALSSIEITRLNARRLLWEGIDPTDVFNEVG